jgi:hypothetical protein
MFVSANPSAKLVQLGKTESVGIVDYHRVGVGDVQAGFNYCRAYEYVGFSADEFYHCIFESVFGHLTVHDIDANFRVVYNNTNLLGGFVYRLDTVMHKKDLAVAI